MNTFGYFAHTTPLQMNELDFSSQFPKLEMPGTLPFIRQMEQYGYNQFSHQQPTLGLTESFTPRQGHLSHFLAEYDSGMYGIRDQEEDALLYDFERPPAKHQSLELRVEELERQDRLQAREINQLTRELNSQAQMIERLSRRLRRLNQRLRNVENRLGISYSSYDGDY